MRSLLIAGILLLLCLACASRSLSDQERTYFKHLYFGMLDEFQESEDICHIHKVPTTDKVITSYAGIVDMPNDAYIQARVRQFPNSFLCAYTGYCTSGDFELKRKVCPKCRQAEILWLTAHGLPIPKGE